MSSLRLRAGSELADVETHADTVILTKLAPFQNKRATPFGSGASGTTVKLKR